MARGDVISLAPDHRTSVVGEVRPAGSGCAAGGYELARVELASLIETPLGSRCRRLLGLAARGDDVLVSELRNGRPVIRAVGSDEVLLRGYVVVSASPNGDLLLADPEGGTVRALGVWPETATGTLFLWDGVRPPAPLVDGVRLFGERLVSWSVNGEAAVVSGIVGGDRAMYGVRDGTRSLLLPPNSFPIRSAYSGATFAADGTVFAASVGSVVMTVPTGVEPLELPADAPFPLGPVAWLP